MHILSLLLLYGSLTLSTAFLISNLTISIELYLYAWPLVMTSLTRTSMFYLPDNIMLAAPVFPNPNLTAIVKPNVDTLYDACWINHNKVNDLTLTIPDTSDGLYFLFPLMDAWTNIIDSPGWRTTGTSHTSVLIRGPQSTSSPDNDTYDLILNSTTSMMYLLGRTNVADQNDLRPTQKQLFSYDLSKNSDGLKEPPKKVLDKSNPVEEIFSMTPQEFYDTFAELMVTNKPIMPQDEEIVSKMEKEFGLIPGEPWAYADLSASQQEELATGMTKGIDMMYSYPVTRVNGWTIPDMNTGAYSTDYYLRAYIGLVLYAASLPQDTVYYESGMYSGGGKVYEMEFTPEAGGTPPTNQFWSLTMYTDLGYLVPNENNTYSVSSQQPLVYRPDGSLHITMSMTPPADMSTTNWLPAPQSGDDFQLTLRVFWPGDEILQKSWFPPPVTEVNTQT